MYPKIVLALLLLLSFGSLHSQKRNKVYEDYIRRYHSIAQRQQSSYGIPSSIILAQGLLESSAGTSYLAINANNHFGIKCHNWSGETEYRDDDRRNECFRKYKHPLDSYEDHSLFITGRKRYASLFRLSPTDYQGWAHGLKKAGYATDPAYAYKLISIIETYGLHQYDLDKVTGEKRQRDFESPQAKPAVTAPTYEEFVMGYVDAVARHNVYYNNGVRCVVAVQGDTYGSIADEFNISEKRIRSYNDAAQDQELQPGDWVYIRPKKKRANKKYPQHQVHAGESMYDIAQYYGIRLKVLYDRNGMAYSSGPQMNQILKLR